MQQNGVAHDHGVWTALPTTATRGAVRLEATAGEHGTAQSHEETGRTVSGIEALSISRPLPP